jgi:hypothetical protein
VRKAAGREEQLHPTKPAAPVKARFETMNKPKIKTASELKYHVESAGNCPHFFTRDSMKFFGDTMSNYGIRQPVQVETNLGETVPAYELTRRRPVKHGLQSSTWFHAETFERIHPAR